MLGLLGMAPSGIALLRTSRFLYFALIFGLGRVLGCLGNGHGTLWHVYFHSLYCGKLWQGWQEHFQRLKCIELRSQSGAAPPNAAYINNSFQ